MAIPPALPEDDVQLFGYALSRDLKVSLRPIMGLSQHLIESPAREDEAGLFCAKINDSAHSLERQMDALATYARLCSRRVNPAVVELGPLWQVVRRQQLELNAGAEEWVQLSGDFPCVRADRGVLQLVFSELLANALKFSRPPESPCVRVQSELRGGRVELTISDRGPGIPDDCLPLLGQPFQKFHHGPGVGLGLTLVRRALAMIQGQLRYLSLCGQGSTFLVSLEAA